jgi:hypothetical protein
MKALILLSILQLGLLVVLLLEDTGQPSAAPVEVEDSVLRVVEAREQQPGISEAEFRSIIREELALLTPKSAAVASVDVVITTETETETSDSGQLEYVAQQIDYYTSVGAISDAEMDALQVEVARLSGADRKRMLSKLVMALNAGEIDGKLL